MASMARLECPNCKKQHQVYETETFSCTDCGTAINVADESNAYSLKQARQKAKRDMSSRLKVIGSISSPILVVLLLGYTFRGLNLIAILILILSLGWFLCQRLLYRKSSASWVIAVAAFLFALGGFAHDLVSPPTARCVDGSYSYSGNDRGTCSHHRGVAEWNPSPWWIP